MELRYTCVHAPLDAISDSRMVMLMEMEERDSLVCACTTQTPSLTTSSSSAKFLVSVKHPGVVSLQSMADTSKWLRVTDKGNLDGKVSIVKWLLVSEMWLVIFFLGGRTCMDCIHSKANQWCVCVCVCVYTWLSILTLLGKFISPSWLCCSGVSFIPKLACWDPAQWRAQGCQCHTNWSPWPVLPLLSCELISCKIYLTLSLPFLSLQRTVPRWTKNYIIIKLYSKPFPTCENILSLFMHNNNNNKLLL